jgi:hypothetical protein
MPQAMPAGHAAAKCGVSLEALKEHPRTLRETAFFEADRHRECVRRLLKRCSKMRADRSYSSPVEEE